MKYIRLCNELGLTVEVNCLWMNKQPSRFSVKGTDAGVLFLHTAYIQGSLSCLSMVEFHSWCENDVIWCHVNFCPKFRRQLYMKSFKYIDRAIHLNAVYCLSLTANSLNSTAKFFPTLRMLPFQLNSSQWGWAINLSFLTVVSSLSARYNRPFVLGLGA